MKTIKRLLFLAFFVPIFCQGQATTDSLVRSKISANILTNNERLNTAAKLREVLNGMVDWVGGTRVPVATSAGLRAGVVGNPDAVVLVDKQGYTFRYDANSNMPDDSAIVIRRGTRRYVRVTDHLEPEFWGGKPDASQQTGEGTDNTKAIQKSWDFAKISGLPVKLSIGTYKITKPLRFSRNDGFAGPGFTMAGAGQYLSRIMPSGITGSALRISGNDALVYGDHVHNVSLNGFAIVRDFTSNAVTNGLEFRSIFNSAIENISIESLKGDGIRVVGVMINDYGANEVSTFKNIYIRFNEGYGIKAYGELFQAVSMAQCTMERVFVNSNGKGVYLDGVQQIKMDYCGIIGNLSENFEIGYNGVVSDLIDLDHCEIGNLTTATAMMTVYAVRSLKVNKCRFINNENELATAGIVLGAGSYPYLKTIDIIEPWVVQSNVALTGYRWLKTDPSVIDVNADIGVFNIKGPPIAAGKYIDDIRKLNIFFMDRRMVRSAGQPEVYLPNPVTVSPKVEDKMLFISYDSTRTTTILNPAVVNPPRAGDKLTFIVRKIAGNSTITWGNNYQLVNSIMPDVGKYKYFNFTFSKETNFWYQDGQPGTIGADRLRSEFIYTVNTDSIAPDISYGTHILSFNTPTAATIANPVGGPQTGDEIGINVRSFTSGVTLTWGSKYAVDSTAATASVPGRFYQFRYSTVYDKWFQK